MDTVICQGDAVDLLMKYIPDSLRLAILLAGLGTVGLMGLFLVLWFSALNGTSDARKDPPRHLNVLWGVAVVYCLGVSYFDLKVITDFIVEWDKAQHAYDLLCLRPLINTLVH